MATPQVDKVLALAKTQVGYREGYSGGHYNNYQKYSPAVPGLAWSQNQAWCQTFMSWLFYKTGLGSLTTYTASCLTACNWYKARSRFSYYPAIGAMVFFGASGGSHVGIVYKYDSTYVYTIEGNTNTSGSAEGNGVYYKTRTRRDSYTYGYGMPKYAEGIVTADPGKKGVAGYTYKAAATWLPTPEPAPAPTPTPVPPAPTPVVQMGTYWVVSGDTFNGIAVKVGLTAAALRYYNPSLANPDVIVPGQGLNVPLSHLVKYGYVSSTPATTTGKISATQVTFNRHTATVNIDDAVQKACTAAGVIYSSAWVRGYKTAISRESSGNANACNVWDSNAITPAGYAKVKDYGDGYYANGTIARLNGALTPFQCSRGIVQCIPQTFAYYHAPGTSLNIYDPVASIAASIRYVRGRYGVSSNGSDLANKVQQFDPNRPAKGY